MATLTVIYHNLQPKNSIKNRPNMTKVKFDIFFNLFSNFLSLVISDRANNDTWKV